jgi:hypothetical protein
MAKNDIVGRKHLIHVIQDTYLEYVNDYLTITTFAEHKGLTYEEAEDLIRLGRKLHERIVAENKQFFEEHFQIIHVTDARRIK